MWVVSWESPARVPCYRHFDTLSAAETFQTNLDLDMGRRSVITEDHLPVYPTQVAECCTRWEVSVFHSPGRCGLCGRTPKVVSTDLSGTGGVDGADPTEEVGVTRTPRHVQPTEGHHMTDVSPATRVSQHLTAIVQMMGQLETQAYHHANSGLMPGGLAMVALAYVSNQEAWTHVYEAAEHHGRPTDHIEDEDDSWEPPLQTLCFWSEQWRATLGGEYDGQSRPTVASEANYLRHALDWAVVNEPHFDQMADDIAAAKTRLENVIAEGLRDIVSEDVLCLLCETRLRRRNRPRRGQHEQRTGHPEEGLEDDWWCPQCGKHLAPHEFYFAAAEVAAKHLLDTEEETA